MQVGTGKSILNGIAIGKLKLYKKKNAVISAADGREIFTSPGRTGMVPRADGSVLVVTGSMTSGTPTNGPVVVVRPDGTTSDLAGMSVESAAVMTPTQRMKMGRLVLHTLWMPLPRGFKMPNIDL